MELRELCLIVPLAPLAAAIVAGLLCRVIPRSIATLVCILGCAVAFVASAVVFFDVRAGASFDGAVYTWVASGATLIETGFLIDPLSSLMMLVVTFVSLTVHIYAVGYMRDDASVNRFFAYIALFTASMLILVMSNNFIQLFFGWEAVGLVSYLLIGFWHERPTARAAATKAFLVNRVGDLGLILGIGLIFVSCGTLDYASVFRLANETSGATFALFGASESSLLSVICILLFVGAMAKSAQIPLHVWLPDSMEGPTPISALIHAATMVTAGIFMVARVSPLFELSETALSFVLVVGATSSLLMGFLGIVETDIKRIVAYSTLSQLGYMVAALGASAYSAAIFHLTTHAFFKALLFLAAGSVIVGMHHEQDVRRMGGLRKYMPVTALAALVGSLALAGVPFFSGFYSKDALIEAVAASGIPGAGFASFSLLTGVFVTAFYTFRMYFLVFHGKERFSAAHGFAPGETPRESPPTMTFPLILLAVPSAAIGYFAIEPMLFGGFFRDAIATAENHAVVEKILAHFTTPLEMAMTSPASGVFWLTLAGVASAAFLYLMRPTLPAALRSRAGVLVRVLENKYYFDALYKAFGDGVRSVGKFLWLIVDTRVIDGTIDAAARGVRWIGKGLWQSIDGGVIDGIFVGGSARAVGAASRFLRRLQSGQLAGYAFFMIAGVCAMLSAWFFTQTKGFLP
ncbi:MAG: NADH-quinone oxidoreductase subunit L [Candidatus Accumulibacter sp.]|jgi:NADH-quinone oxidoreductase subunit L|nr:NADH-quinone oxidoreductase subunit L [Accumulibacter sp.]